MKLHMILPLVALLSVFLACAPVQPSNAVTIDGFGLTILYDNQQISVHLSGLAASTVYLVVMNQISATQTGTCTLTGTNTTLATVVSNAAADDIYTTVTVTRPSTDAVAIGVKTTLNGAYVDFWRADFQDPVSADFLTTIIFGLVTISLIAGILIFILGALRGGIRK